MKTYDISIDTFDALLIVAMVGGFATGNWIPLVVFCFIGSAERLAKVL